MINVSNSSPIGGGTDDFNSDNQTDILVTDHANGIVNVLFSYGNGSFISQIRFSTSSWSVHIALVDVNNNVRQDLIITNNRIGNSSILLNTCQ